MRKSEDVSPGNLTINRSTPAPRNEGNQTFLLRDGTNPNSPGNRKVEDRCRRTRAERSQTKFNGQRNLINVLDINSIFNASQTAVSHNHNEEVI
jgi:hypothetical protein